MTENLTTALRTMIARRLKIDLSLVPLDRSFQDMGLKSLDAVIVSGQLEELIGIEVDPTLLFEHQTITAVVAVLTEEETGGKYV